MKSNLVISSTIIIPAPELQFTFARASGPGGQNVNKVNSKATLRWNIYASKSSLPWAAKDRFIKANSNKITAEGDFIISSSESRDQLQNIESCLQRLRDAIKKSLTPPKKRFKTKPTRGSKEKRIQSKKINSQKKQLRRVHE